MTSAEVGAATGERLGYRPGLDALRGVAVALVLASHVLGEGWRLGGRAGVSMFLTLSGFLITKQLLEERDRTGGVSRAGFYRRRAARLLPVLPAVLVLCAWVNASRGFPVAVPLVTSALYVQNLAVGAGWEAGAFHHLWSLALEEQFYVVWPLVFVAVPHRRLLAVLLWSVPGVLAVRVGLLAVGWAEIGRVSGFSRLDGLTAGCALAFLIHRFGTPRLPRGSGVVAWIAIGTLALHRHPFDWFADTAWFTLIAVASAVLVVVALDQDTPPRPLVELGKISYGVYLWHVPIMWLLLPYGPIVVVAVSLWVAMVSYRFIEVPAKAWIAGSGAVVVHGNRAGGRGRRLDREGRPGADRLTPDLVCERSGPRRVEHEPRANVL